MPDLRFPRATRAHFARRPTPAPEAEVAFRVFSRVVIVGGALVLRAKQLFAVVGAHVTLCIFCIEGHVKGALRRWFHVHPDAWKEFRAHFLAELVERVYIVRQIADCAREAVVRPVYAAMNQEHDAAAVLRDHLAVCLRGKEDAR